MEDKRKYHIIIGSKAYFDASLPDFLKKMRWILFWSL